MPQRCEPAVSNFTLEIYRGASCSEGFQYLNPDGTPVDISGKVVAFGLKNIFDSTFKLTSGDAPTTLGSSIEITDAVNGEFRFLITDEETETANLGTGRWWVEVRDGGDVKLLWRDTAVVYDI
jgi:hypothetical protein